MVDTSRSVKVTIDPRGAETGAARFKAAMRSMTDSSSQAEARAKKLAAANDDVGTSWIKATRAANDNAAAFGRAGIAAEGAASRVQSLSGVLRAIAGLGIPGVLAGIAAGFVALGIAGLEAAAKVEKFQANLLTMTKSTTAMRSAWAGLVEFANKTPFTLDQSVEGFTKLRALGLATSEAIMMSYGNTAAAMGKTMSQMVEAVADATTGEFERLKEFGIKAKQSGDSVAFTFQGVTTKVGKNAKEIQDYLVKIGSVNFGGAMSRQMDTLSGAFSNFEDKLFIFMSSMGDGMFGNAVKGIVNAAAEGIGAITPLFSGLMDIIGGLLSGLWEIAKGFGSVFTAPLGGADNFKSVLDGIAVAASYIGSTFEVIGKTIGAVLGFVGNAAGAVVDGLFGMFGDFFGWIVPSWDLTGQSAGESMVGILRAAQYVAGELPAIFSAALADLKTMFSSTGDAIAKSLTGDFSGWGKVDLSFGKTQKAISTTWAEAQKTFGDRKANRAWIDNAAGRSAKGNIDFAALGDGKSTSSSKKDADEAERKAKAQADFWKGLENELALSKLTTQEAEKRRKELEYEKIIGRDINAGEKERLATLMASTKANQFIQQANEDHRTRMIDLDTEQALLAKKTAGATEEQLSAERTALEFAASIKKANLAIDEQTLATLTDQVRKEAERNAEIAKQNRLLAAGDAALSKYSSTYAARMTGQENADAKAGLDARLANGTITKAEYDEAMSGMARAATEAANQFKSDFASRISELGQQFGGKFGEQISKLGNALQKIVGNANGNFGGGVVGGIMGLIGKNPLTGKNNKLGDAFQDANQKLLDGLFSSNTWNKPLESLSKGFGDFKGDLHNLFGKGGDFTKGLGSVLGKAGAGADMGGTIAGLIGGDSTGGQVGGALGSLALGPIGGIVGGLIGGILGGLFKKTPMGSAVITGVNEGDMRVSGNKSSIRENLTTAGGSIQQGVQSVADAFGAMVGNFAVSIGQRGDYYRVSKSGSDAVGNKTYPSRMRDDVLYDGKDAETAIKIAIRDAIGDGALLGVSDFTKRIIANDPNLDRAVQIAKSYEDVLTALKASKDPVQAAVDAATKGIDQLITQMKSAGATASELANAEAYRADMLKKAREQETKGFTDFLETLNRSASGKSPLALLNEDLAKFREMEAKLAAGGTVDQNSFTDLANKVLGGAGDIYGSQTAAFQSIASELKTATEKALANTNAAFGGDKTVTAIQDQTTQIVDQLQQMNYSLSQLASMGYGVSLSSALNGQMLRTY